MKVRNIVIGFFIISTVVLISLTHLATAETDIKNIIDNPGRFHEEQVTLEGTVTQWVPSTSGTTSYYLFKGKSSTTRIAGGLRKPPRRGHCLGKAPKGAD